MPDLASFYTGDDECSEIGGLFDLVTARPAWHADALCKEAPAEVTWFASRGEDQRAAKAVCGRCLVRTECLAWAVAQGPELDGVWGGLGERERRTLTRSAATLAAKPSDAGRQPSTLRQREHGLTSTFTEQTDTYRHARSA